MTDIYASQNSRIYSWTGAWGAGAGLVACLIAWYRLDFTSTWPAIALYVLIPVAFLALTLTIHRLQSVPQLVARGVVFVGYVAFCYGMFLLLLRQHVV